MFHVDDSCFPFVVDTWSGVVTDADLVAREQWQHERAPRGEHWVTLADCRALQLPDGEVRRRIAEGMKRLDALPGAKMRATAFVFSNPVLAGTMRAIRWLVPRQKPEAYVTTPVEGLDWLERTAPRFEIVLPETSRALVQRLLTSTTTEAAA